MVQMNVETYFERTILASICDEAKNRSLSSERLNSAMGHREILVFYLTLRFRHPVYIHLLFWKLEFLLPAFDKLYPVCVNEG